MTSVSVIICTRNRAAALRKTLEAFFQVSVPTDFVVELLVVDNASTDDTEDVLAEMLASLIHFGRIWLNESRPGKSNALNLAMQRASGEVLLFTDDDVLPPIDWIERMVGPITEGHADAVAGGLRLGPEINSLGLGAEQRSWLATTEYCTRQNDPPLIGANMAIARRVFDVIPWFDPEVGPGATGHAEDTLFWLQVRAAGFRIVPRYDIVAEHNPDPSRAGRHGLSHLAKKRGEFAAYLDYHWNRIDRRHPYFGLAKSVVKLWLARARRMPEWLRARTLPAWEMELLEHYHFRRWLLHERRRPPNYDRHGFVKRRGLLPSSRDVAASTAPSHLSDMTNVRCESSSSVL